jgi:hypothetical protein
MRRGDSWQLAGGSRQKAKGKAQRAERHERRGRTLCAVRLAPGESRSGQ